VLDQALQLGAGDRRLGGLDGVGGHQVLQRRLAGRPALGALAALGAGVGFRLEPDGLAERVPQLDVRGLLGGVLLQLGPDGGLRGPGGRVHGLGQGDHRVAVLAGVEAQLAGLQLSRAPALVEGMLQHVPAVTDGVEAGEEVHVSPLSAGQHRHPMRFP
jgi:hypothetical protein